MGFRAPLQVAARCEMRDAKYEMLIKKVVLFPTGPVMWLQRKD